MKLFKNECYKLFRTKKLYIFAGIHLFFIVVNLLSYKPGLDEDTIWTFTNGQSAPLALAEIYVQFMMFFIPIFIADTISREYQQGTLKLSLLYPVDRNQLIKAKIMSLMVMILSLTVFFLVVSYALGVYHLGWGNVFEYEGLSYGTIKGIFITIGSYLILTVPAMAYGIFVICLALMTGDQISTIIGSSGLMILGMNLNGISIGNPYSPAYHFSYLYRFFVFENMGRDGIIAIIMTFVYLFIFTSISFLSFKKKDLVY
ncbi:ABC transporter permease [Vagococcus acidifermentans]|uniref:ABC transporter permease n=1 Tax=Vagococcus acidifermentans TaxID=564710 RepID=A0A430AL91_9ENTE|nr:ABC transporter permease [Vagococcus acidifermentans]RSU08900.1 hypothetical protein CBF27_13905 [Vagococcus acidifermentans]